MVVKVFHWESVTKSTATVSSESSKFNSEHYQKEITKHALKNLKEQTILTTVALV